MTGFIPDRCGNPDCRACSNPTANVAAAPGVAGGEPTRPLIEALTHAVEQAVDIVGADGWVSGYWMPTGAIHKAIPLLAEHGVTARPRPFSTGKTAAFAAAEAAGAARVVAAVEALHSESEFGFEHDCADGIGDGCAYVLAARGATGGGT